MRSFVGVLVASACAAFLLGGSSSSHEALAAPLPACTTAALVPSAGAVTINQGLPYARLARGKETLVRFYLTRPSACTGTINVTAATLTATSGAATFSVPAYQSFGSTGVSIPSSSVSTNSNADPLFVIPGNRLNPCLVDLAADSCLDAAGALTFTASVSYTQNGVAAAAPAVLSAPNPATVEQKSRALRILVVPMGDASLSYTTQFTAAGQTAVQNGLAALSRMLPVPGGTGSLGSASGGVRYTINLAAMLNLKGPSVPASAYVNGKFCGSGTNWNAIKGELAQFLQSWNTENPNAQADRVLGAVDSTISSGASAGCAEGMASVVSNEAWVRGIPDQPAGGGKPAQPSMTGSLAGMELGHTFGLVPLSRSASRHSPNSQADTLSPDRGYHVFSRSYIASDKSDLKLDTSTSPWNNNVTLLEPLDFAYALCALGGTVLAGSECAAAGPAGTGTTEGVLAAGQFVMSGTTDGTPGGTDVVESYFSTGVEQTPLDPSSPYHVVQYDGNGNPLADQKVPVSLVISGADHTSEQQSVGVFSVSVEGFAADRIEFKKDDTVLYARERQDDPPVVTSVTAVGPAATETIQKTVIPPAIAPKPDIYFLADTTGSMGAALTDVRDNAASIIGTVNDKTTDARFGAGDYKDFPAGPQNPYAFKNAAPIPATDDGGDDALLAIGGWSTAPGQGGDGPEGSFYALHQLAAGGANFRSDSTPIIVWFGDAPSHDPICSSVTGGLYTGADITEASVTAALQAARIKVLAVSITGEFQDFVDGLDGDPAQGNFDYGSCANAGTAGQASRIAPATGGFHRRDVTYTEVADAIVDGLENLPATVTPAATCDPGLTVTFDEPSKTVTSGTPVTFDETVSTAAGASGVLSCTVVFSVNGEQVKLESGELDPRFVQTITKDLAAAASGQTTLAVDTTSAVPSLVTVDLTYDCDTFDYVAFVGLANGEVSGAISSFNANVDTTRACGEGGGLGTLTAVASDGIERSDPEAAEAKTPVDSGLKPPVAAIYSPTQDAVIGDTSKMPLNGSGFDPEDGVLGPPGLASVEWLVSGPGLPETSFGTTRAVDVAPPGGIWATGDYLVKHRVTDTDGQADVATTTVHVVHLGFGGFLQPIDPPPTLNTGRAGRTYPVKWQLRDANGNFIRSLSVVLGTRFRPITCPSGTPTDSIETITSGASSLRYDTATEQYVYNWASPSQPGCYVFELTLIDGLVYEAYFMLTR